MSAKKSSKNTKGNRKGGNASNKRANKPVASKPKVVVQKAKPTPPPVTKKVSRPAAKTSSKSKAEASPATLPFTKQNYILLAIGVAIIILGFFLMSLDDFVDATKFSISLYIAPIVVIAGFAEIIYAIMYRPKSSPQTQETGQ
ncbi:MAG: DUF3098 domain-containing protein [Bacteroidota bacterium]